MLVPSYFRKRLAGGRQSIVGCVRGQWTTADRERMHQRIRDNMASVPFPDWFYAGDEDGNDVPVPSHHFFVDSQQMPCLGYADLTYSTPEIQRENWEAVFRKVTDFKDTQPIMVNITSLFSAMIKNREQPV